MGLGLASEAGEVCGVIKKWVRDDAPLNDLHKELGDCFYYLVRICDELGWEAEEIVKANQKKLTDRKERGVLSGSGNDR